MGRLEIVMREVSGCNNNVMREIEPNNCLDCYKRTLFFPKNLVIHTVGQGIMMHPLAVRQAIHGHERHYALSVVLGAEIA